MGIGLYLNIRNIFYDFLREVNIFAAFLDFGRMKTADSGKLSKKLGERIRELRLATGMSTREFADTAGIAHSQVYKIDNGLVDPKLSTLQAIADTLGVSLSDLLKGIT